MGVGWVGVGVGGGGVGKEFSITPARAHPSRPGPRAANVCARTIQLNPTRCVLRSYLGKAKYILSYQRRRMSDWNSEFYPRLLRTSPPGPNANTSITPPHFQAEQMEKWTRQRRKNNQHQGKKTNSDTECHLGRLVSVQSHTMGWTSSKYIVEQRCQTMACGLDLTLSVILFGP